MRLFFLTIIFCFYITPLKAQFFQFGVKDGAVFTRSAEDGGLPCTDSSECKGVCEYIMKETGKEAVDKIKSIVENNTAVKGQCSKSVTQIGRECFFEINKGHIWNFSTCTNFEAFLNRNTPKKVEIPDAF